MNVINYQYCITQLWELFMNLYSCQSLLLFFLVFFSSYIVTPLDSHFVNWLKMYSQAEGQISKWLQHLLHWMFMPLGKFWFIRCSVLTLASLPGQHHGCPCIGNIRRQDISSQAIDLVIPFWFQHHKGKTQRGYIYIESEKIKIQWDGSAAPMICADIWPVGCQTVAASGCRFPPCWHLADAAGIHRWEELPR